LRADACEPPGSAWHSHTIAQTLDVTDAEYSQTPA
jgi:hypothetical protein